MRNRKDAVSKLPIVHGKQEFQFSKTINFEIASMPSAFLYRIVSMLLLFECEVTTSNFKTYFSYYSCVERNRLP